MIVDRRKFALGVDMSMLSEVAPWDLVAEGYTDTTMRLFRGYIDAALDLVPLGKDDRIADIACGPGTLSLAAANRVGCVKALDFSENMLAMLRQGMAEQGARNIEPHHGDGQDLPFEDGEFDAVFSMFGLMFFPDRPKGYAELFRTLKPGGRACVSSWAPVSRSPIMAAMFGAMQAIKPEIPDPIYDLTSLENPDVLEAELNQMGFRDVIVHPVTHGAEIESAERFWNKYGQGQRPRSDAEEQHAGRRMAGEVKDRRGSYRREGGAHARNPNRDRLSRHRREVTRPTQQIHYPQCKVGRVSSDRWGWAPSDRSMASNRQCRRGSSARTSVKIRANPSSGTRVKRAT